MASVAIEGLAKHIGKTRILEGVDLLIPDGAFAVLVGPSGCGKSTLLRTIAGLERPTTGTIRFGERDVTNLEPRERDVAMVFQSYALYPHLTVRENLAFGLRLRKIPEAEVTAKVAEASRMLGLDALLERMPKALSGGQRQRVAMGRAIVRRPGLFLFDEPLSNLDAALRGQVRVEIRKLHNELGTTSIYVTHDQVEAMTLADVMFVLNGGRVEQAGPPLEVYEHPRTRFVAGFLGSPAMNFLEAKLARVDGAIVAEVAGICVPVAQDAFEGLAVGRAVTLGIRPHDLAPVEPRAGAIPLVLELVEELGGETFVHARVGEHPLVLRLDAGFRVRVGETLHVQAAPSQVHLFDRETGASLRC
ncbi:MAG: sn-glycerol-3-phosphate ABC transporter ATP-binding protein UgpC [Deltaproteobacteria bacterium]|nr:sn-glycerol-3-phosphate ABC transporter ATP-binding protein UgpC [Deltaproteobacteria bacterium]